MAKKALLILAEDAEETELVTTVDVLRRAGIDVSLNFREKYLARSRLDVKI